MKYILFCTTLLLLTGLCLCGRLARADGDYSASVTLATPTANASYEIKQQSDGYYAAIPISVTN